MNDIFKMAEQAYHALSIAETELKRLYKENAELKNSLNREWVGLTREEVQSIVNLCTFDSGGYDVFTDCTQVACIVESRLKEKNHDYR